MMISSVRCTGMNVIVYIVQMLWECPVQTLQERISFLREQRNPGKKKKKRDPAED